MFQRCSLEEQLVQDMLCFIFKGKLSIKTWYGDFRLMIDAKCVDNWEPLRCW